MKEEREVLKSQLMEFVKRVSGVNPGLKISGRSADSPGDCEATY